MTYMCIRCSMPGHRSHACTLEVPAYVLPKIKWTVYIEGFRGRWIDVTNGFSKEDLRGPASIKAAIKSMCIGAEYAFENRGEEFHVLLRGTLFAKYRIE